MIVYDTASQLHNELLRIYFDEHNNFSGAKRKKMDSKPDFVNSMLDTYDLQHRLKMKMKN